jgi:drug/metabolite transporter (DMT)-like permease
VYKAIGVSLAIASGVFIGVSFVLKKKGLLKANVKYSEEAGEGYSYLKNAWWWTGMTLMIIGEICNFVAYAFVEAILVTPLGALSVVITAILSSIFLKERLSFVGKIGCFICLVGAAVIVINAPEQSSAATIQEMQHFVIAPGFLSYAGVIIVACICIVIFVAPRYGKKSMLVYLSICSLIGGLSVVATQGLGAAVVAQAAGTPQFNQWFLYVLLVFVIVTLLTEIIYLNKALNIFNAALVTPTYYVFFTSSTIVTSAILFRGFKGTPSSIATVVMGFLEICCGVVLLQLSKSAKNVPDTEIFKGDLDQVRTVAEQEEPESEPKADAIRGTAAIVRRISQYRQKAEVDEARRVYEDRLKDLQPIGEDDQAEWDGVVRRRSTWGGRRDTGGLERRKTLHPPLGLTKFPDPEDEEVRENDVGHDSEDGVLGSMRKRVKSVWVHQKSPRGTTPEGRTHFAPYPLTEISVPATQAQDTPARDQFGPESGQSEDSSQRSTFVGLPKGLRTLAPHDSPEDVEGHPTGTPIRWAEDVGNEKARSAPSLQPDERPSLQPGSAKRQFSFQNVFHRNRDGSSPRHETPPDTQPAKRIGLGSRQSSKEVYGGVPVKGATEEERLGLVKGDSRSMLNLPDYQSDEEEDWGVVNKPRSQSPARTPAALPGYSDTDAAKHPAEEEKERETYEQMRERWRTNRRGSETEEERQEREIREAKEWETQRDNRI